MADNKYDKGDRIAITTGTVFQDVATSTPFDPDTVTFKVKDPAGTTTTYVYGTDAEVTKVTTGSYKLTIDVDTSGMWYYRIEGDASDATNRGADEGSFEVKESQF